MNRSVYTTALFCAILMWSPGTGFAQVPEFDEGLAWEHLLAQCKFGPRVPGSAAHERCYDYLENELKKRTPTVYAQPFIAVNPHTESSLSLKNLVAEFWGDRTRRVLLCAHWDTRPRADRDPDPERRDEPVPGANDGASGVAVLLEVARCIAAEDPGIGVDIVLFDGEDMGREGHFDEYCLGSQWYAENLSYPLPEAAILLDMVGDADLYIPQEIYSKIAAPRLMDEVYALAVELDEDAFDAHRGQAVYDDHVHLLQSGIEAINLIDFDYAYWHTVNDVPENCSPASLGSVGRVVLAWIYQRAVRQ